MAFHQLYAGRTWQDGMRRITEVQAFRDLRGVVAVDDASGDTVLASLDMEVGDLWRLAACHGDGVFLSWLKKKGMGGSLNAATDHRGVTPLMWAACSGNESAIRWLISNGADVSAVHEATGSTIFLLAVGSKPSLGLVRELVDVVPLENLGRPDESGHTPMEMVFVNTDEPELRRQLVKMLVLRGAPVRFQDFPSGSIGGVGSFVKAHLELLEWAETEYAMHRAFCFLLGGVHDGNSPLSLLRGDANTDVRMRIGAYVLGVSHVATERRLRNALAVWRGIHSAREGVLFSSERSREKAAVLERKRYGHWYDTQQSHNSGKPIGKSGGGESAS